MSDNAKKGIIAVLILLIGAIGVYSYLEHEKQNKTIDTLIEDKAKIIAELEKMEANYNAEISKNTALSSDLEKQKNIITRFKDSIRNLKNTNWNTIKFYKNKIKNLTFSTNRLFAKNDSLVKANEILSQEKDSLTQNLTQQTIVNDTLFRQNENLSQKVAIAQKIRANGYRVETFDKRRNGKFKPTDKARRTNTFKVSFFINENPLATDKEIQTYVVLKNKKGNALNTKGFFTTKDGERVAFTESTVIPFRKNTIATDILLNVENIKLEKGTYVIDIYMDNKKMSSLKKVLQ